MPQKPLSTQAAQTDQHHSTSTKSKPDAPRNSGGLNTGGLGFVITRPDRAARLPMPEPVPMGGDGHRLKVGDLQDTWRQWPKPTNPCCSSGATRSPGGAEMCTQMEEPKCLVLCGSGTTHVAFGPQGITVNPCQSPFWGMFFFMFSTSTFILGSPGWKPLHYLGISIGHPLEGPGRQQHGFRGWRVSLFSNRPRPGVHILWRLIASHHEKQY